MAAFQHFIQVDSDSVWLILNDTCCPQPIVPSSDTLPPVHVNTSRVFLIDALSIVFSKPPNLEKGVREWQRQRHITLV